MSTNEAICPSCGSLNVERYCAQCGERRRAARDYTIKGFLADALGEITNVDAKLYATLRLLALKPGELTREFMRGRRVPYVRPLQLFVIANFVYFLVQPLTGYSGYNTPLSAQMDRQFYSNPAGIASAARHHAAARRLDLRAYEALYNAKSELYAKSLILLMVPLLALGAALLHVGRRRPFLEHLVFALHYYAFELLFVSSFYLLIYGALLLPMLKTAFLSGLLTRTTPFGSFVWLLITELPTLVLIIPYLIFAFRRVYADSWPGALARGALCIPLLLAVTIAYRFLLFWITVATV